MMAANPQNQEHLRHLYFCFFYHLDDQQIFLGQLSSAMTAKGTVSLGTQFADPHGVGVLGGNISAMEAAANKARLHQSSNWYNCC